MHNTTNVSFKLKIELIVGLDRTCPKSKISLIFAQFKDYLEQCASRSYTHPASMMVTPTGICVQLLQLSIYAAM